MKKALIASFITLLTLTSSAFAQDLPVVPAHAGQTGKTDLTASSTPIVKEVEIKKAEPLATRKQKIEAELRSTVTKLTLVIDRTQKLIDLLNKNGKDTEVAGTLLIDARTSLEEAINALDQFAGISPIEPSTQEAKTDEKSYKLTKEVVILKDPLKKTQDSLKASKASLIESIATLKETLSPKEDGQQ